MKTKVNVSAENSFNIMSDFPEFVDGPRYMELYNEADPVSYTHLDVYKRQDKARLQPPDRHREPVHYRFCTLSEPYGYTDHDLSLIHILSPGNFWLLVKVLQSK